MGRIKYISKIRELFKESPIVSLNSLKKIIDKRDKRYVHLIIHNITKRGEIKRITKGFYTIYDDPSLAVFCFKPSYIGLQDALSAHNLWEQETIPIIITTNKVRPGIRKILGMNVLIRRIDKKYIFGFDFIKHGDFYFPISDIEKTFIDMTYFGEKIDSEALRAFRRRIDIKKLRAYLKKYPKRIREKVDSAL